MNHDLSTADSEHIRPREDMLTRFSNAQRDERFRISRDLHDRIAHGIAAALQRLDLAQMAGSTGVVTSSHLSSARGILQGALRDTRELAVDLHQAIGARFLDDAVTQYLQDASSLGVHGTVTVTGQPFLMPAPVGEELFLLLREAIRNAAAHSGAYRVFVGFAWSEHRLTAEVQDSGVGFDLALAEASPAALGLASMRERAAIAGAQFSITSEHDVGTTVTVSIKLTPDLDG